MNVSSQAINHYLQKWMKGLFLNTMFSTAGKSQVLQSSFTGTEKVLGFGVAILFFF